MTANAVKPSATFPAVGDCQCHAGRANGIWYTWMTYSGDQGRKHAHSSKEDAFAAHDNNIIVIKHYMMIDAGETE
jgi:hypothetical protein